MIGFKLLMLGLLGSLAQSIVIKEQMCGSLIRAEEVIKSYKSNISCIHDEECVQLNCSGRILDKDFQIFAELLLCDEPVGLALSINIPQFNINNWKYNFTKKETKDLKISNSPIHIGSPSMKLNFDPSKEKLVLGLSIQGGGILANKGVQKNLTFSIKECDKPKLSSPLNPTVSNFTTSTTQANKIADKKLSNTSRSCTIGDLSSCQEHEECTEIQANPSMAECFCIPGYYLNFEEECINNSVTPLPISTTNSSDIDAGDNKKTRNILLGVFVTLACIIMSALMFYIARRFSFKLCTRSSSSYDEVLMDQAIIVREDDDDDQPLS